MILYYQLITLIDHAKEAFSKMASSLSPSKLSLIEYRIHARCNEPGSRAANGEMSSLYGREEEPVPSYLFAIVDEDFEPMAQLVATWLLDFVDYVIQSLRGLRNKALGCFGCLNASPPSDDDMRVGAGTVSAIGKVLVCAVAILSLVAPIVTLNYVENQKMRLVVMTAFAQAFALPAQFMGHRSVPMYTLITA